MKGKTTIKDIAKKCGLSICTVSTILNGRSRFSADTDKLVLETAASLNYRKNPLASALHSGKNHIIIGVLGNVYRDSDMELIIQLKRALYQRGYFFMMLFMNAMAAEKKIDFLEQVCNWGAGILILDTGIPEWSPCYPALLKVLKNVPPTISTCHEIVGSAVDYVTVDWGKNLPEVFDYFAQRHCKKVLFCCYDMNVAQQRFIAAGHAAGIATEIWTLPLDKNSGEENFYHYGEMGEKLAAKLLAQRDELPDGIYCASDETAEALAMCFKLAGLRVPDDIAIVGGGDYSKSFRNMQNFPVFCHDPAEMAEVSVEALIERIEGGDTTPGSGKCHALLLQHLRLPRKSNHTADEFTILR
jgi:LacI family transcriptional regulator